MGDIMTEIKKKLNSSELDTLLRVADLMLAGHSDWRQGQTLFNALYELHPILADEIRGDPKLDSFHNDANIGNLLRYLVE